ncbi:MAG: PA0069 family radical SAM protein [Balneolaceae bacterium]
MKPIRGRGTSDNPENRFEKVYLDYDVDLETGEKPSPDTTFLTDHTKEIISTNNSPDIPFNKSLNPYRGCEHGCIYCYARPTHEFLGMSAGLDFESKIVVKHNAPALLKKSLGKPGWKPETLVMSGVTDPYQPAEKELGITRGCIEVLAECRHPLAIITKNHLVTRDIDLFQQLAEHQAIAVTLSITTLDRELAGKMEPRTSRPQRRLDTIRELSAAGIPVSVNVAPIIPGLTDHETAEILEEAKHAGASAAGYTLLRLPYGVKDLFVEWLEQHAPDRKSKVINRILDIRNGEMNRSEFGERFRGEGHYASQIRQLFRQTVQRLGLNQTMTELSASAFRRPEIGQLSLWDRQE